MPPEAHGVRVPPGAFLPFALAHRLHRVRAMQPLPYVIILAGGEGQRLAPLTRALYGTDLPKQFAVLSGGAVADADHGR
jgi:hypothetical protein